MLHRRQSCAANPVWRIPRHHTAPVKTLQEAKEKELIVAGTGADASEVVFPRAANRLAGTKFKVVLGYPGSTEMLLSMERGETQGFCGIGWTFVKLRKGDWLRDKKITSCSRSRCRSIPNCRTCR